VREADFLIVDPLTGDLVDGEGMLSHVAAAVAAVDPDPQVGHVVEGQGRRRDARPRIVYATIFQ
jgi:hypothetical protein